MTARWTKQHFNSARLSDFHRHTRVGGRYLSLPIDEYEALGTFAQANAKWFELASGLGVEATTNALEKANLRPEDINHVFFVTVTGVATPSLDARLANRLRLSSYVKRTPIFGLGCAAGAAGVARAADYLRSFPGETALVLSVELCSLTLQKEDFSVANLIATGLFGDGAAAVLLGGSERSRRGPEILATRSVFYPDTEQLMGWDVVNSGFRVVLSAKVPDVVRQHLRRNVDEFLAEHSLGRSDVRHWIVHTGGPRVLEAFEQSLELPRDALVRSWTSLEQVGNLSSASVLFVLGDFFESGEPRTGDRGLMVAMGPGFGAELVLLQW